jgi:superfamily I DNA/RNA helicase/plasmid maintenance system killer protein
MEKAKVALAKTYLDAFSRLPRKIQKKARETLELFSSDPKSPGLNFEHLPGMKDGKIRSIRVDQAYRMIIVHPPKGDVFLAVWVDHHDDAYDWARRKAFQINPVSGALQFFSVEEGEAALAAPKPEATPVPDTSPSLFEAIGDDDLMLAGVPEPLLPSVRDLRFEAELDRLSPHLPSDASDMLYQLAAGIPFEEALEQASRPTAKVAAVDTEDFEAALERELSQELFHVVEGEEELEQMLDAPLEQWRLFLHPSQRRIVRMEANGPVRVLGGAGTGKTVVLMHRAKHLLDSVFNGPDDRVFVTTFTKNLALDIEQSLGSLCPDHAERVLVKNLHAWALDFYQRKVGERVRVIASEERDRWMEGAVGLAGSEEFPSRFYFEEWDQVVQAQGVDSESGYLRARRVGRGTRLGREQRKAVWRVFAAYRDRLKEEGRLEWDDVVREVRLYLEAEPGRAPFQAVLADEIQDFSTQELRLLRAMVEPGPSDLFLVGDAHQRIYGKMTTLGRCGIEIRGRSRRLRLNYRTTEQIRARAVGVLEGIDIDDLDEGVDDFTGYRSLRGGPKPRIHFLEKQEQEQDVVVEALRSWLDAPGAVPSDICLAARTHGALERYAAILDQAGIAHVEIKKNARLASPGIRLATMHRLKGLEFKRVLLAGVQEGQVPLKLSDASFADDASREDHDRRERCLFYVATTRARDELVVTGFGRRSSFLE